MLDPITLSFTEAGRLSVAAEAGVTSVDYGLLPQRRCQVPRDWPSAIHRFLAPPSPKPSSTRGFPRRPPMTAA